MKVNRTREIRVCRGGAAVKKANEEEVVGVSRRQWRRWLWRLRRDEIKERRMLVKAD